MRTPNVRPALATALALTLSLAVGCDPPTTEPAPDAGPTPDAGATPDAGPAPDTGPTGNRAPVAADDSVEARPGVAVDVDVLANDTDPDGDALEVVGASGATHGTVTSTATGVRYTAALDYLGPDEITYVVGDGRGGLDTGTVHVTVLAGPNTAPVAVDDAVETSAALAVTVDVLANDSDPDGDPLTVASVGDPPGGTASTDGTTVVYTPDPGFTGADTFDYEIRDPSGAPATATVTILVRAAPDAIDDAVTTTEATEVRAAVLANDVHPEGLPITLDAIATPPARGTARIEGDEIVYLPDPGAFGSDSLEYAIRDDVGGTDTATLTITIVRGVISDRITAGGDRSLAIGADGSLIAWGAASPSTSMRAVPMAVGTATDWALVDTGPSHTCAIDGGGALWCWGANGDGQLGLGPGAGSSASAPTRVGTAVGWSEVALGSWHTCGILAGALHCWGEGDNGKLGQGDLVSRDVPTRVGSESDWTSVTAGAEHTCGVRSGQLWCWGYNGADQLGDPALMRQTPSASRIGTDSDWAIVRGGAWHTCGIKLDGSLWCWGRPRGVTTMPTPTRVGTSNGWTDVDVGDESTCGVDGGALYCWGLNDYGQLGDGTQELRATPTRIGTVADWTAVAVGRAHACALHAAGVSCWGARSSGQIGDGVVPGSRTPVQVGTRTDWRDVGATRSDHTCATAADGSLWCWGILEDRPLRAVPTQVGTMLGWSVVPDGGPRHRCAIRSDGGLWCWGSGTYGALGIGTTTGSALPAPVGGTTQFVSIGLGDNHTCGVTSAAGLQCWGLDYYGQLGTDAASPYSNPTPLEIGTDTWTSVAATALDTCGVRTDGSLWCWGYRIGDLPTRIGTDTDWREVVGGRGSACGIKTSGALWCWAMGTSVPAPARVGLDSDWAVVSIADHTCGVRTGGSLWCFGDNETGQLGDGTTTRRTLPVRVGTDSDWADVAAGGGAFAGHTCGIRTDGTLWCWGADASGQLGLGVALALAPVPVTGL